jgi:pilus assembly protein Flp/PilA
MLQWLRDRTQRKGQSMVEYAIILVLVAVVVMVALATVGNQVNATFTDIQEALMNPDDPGAQAPYTCPGGGTAVLHGHKYHCQ